MKRECVPSFVIKKIVFHPGPWPLELLRGEMTEGEWIETQRLAKILNALTPTPRLKIAKEGGEE